MSDTEDQRRPTPPHEALAAWREEKGLTQAAAGAQIGVKGPTWHEYETGGSVPQGGYREAIEIVTGIPAVSWMPEREQRAIAAALAARAGRDALDAEHTEPSDDDDDMESA